jgi:Tfp pilus assembly protein PilF
MTMTTEGRRVAVLLVPLLMAAGLSAAFREARLVGKVVDPEGNPIPGVTVTVTSPSIPEFKEVEVTNDKGVFKVDFERISVVYVYLFEKLGYQATKTEMTVNFQGTKRHEFTISPAETGAVGARPPASTSTPAIVAFNEGVRAFEAEDYEAARAKLEEALGHDPNMRLAWELLTRTLIEQKEYAKAAEAAEKAVALGSTDQSVLRSRWEAYRQLGDEAKTAEAEKELQRIGRLADEAKGIYNAGVALTKDGDDEGAFARFQEALELDPNLQVAQVALATVALRIGRPREAAEAAEAILKASPEDEQALGIRYNAYLKLNDEEKVVDSLVGLAAVDPAMAVANLFHLATLAFDKDESAKAKDRLGKVLAIQPDHPRAHYLLGLIQMREGAMEESKANLERFLELAPNDPDAETAQKLLQYLKG